MLIINLDCWDRQGIEVQSDFPRKPFLNQDRPGLNCHVVELKILFRFHLKTFGVQPGHWPAEHPIIWYKTSFLTWLPSLSTQYSPPRGLWQSLLRSCCPSPHGTFATSPVLQSPTSCQAVHIPSFTIYFWLSINSRSHPVRESNIPFWLEYFVKIEKDYSHLAMFHLPLFVLEQHFPQNSSAKVTLIRTA